MGESTMQINNHHDSSVHKFLPPTMLRVLLVEADDSTRHIISALLRKCGYKVSAVRDGLKAWETLKNKSSEIDLVLTEVELPSISGFSLLTSIMELDICKNIPVIMMSSNDSVSTVFKCMLNGAADFLIKPVRRNELSNLWQHVWRKHTISMPPQNITFPQNKLDVAAENNAASNNSSGSVASTQKNVECSEKTSEAQDMSQLKSSSCLSNTSQAKHENSTRYEREFAEYNEETGEKSTIIASKAAGYDKISTGLRLGQSYDCTETENQDEVLKTEFSKANPHTNTKIHQCNDGIEEHSAGAIDLMATFQNIPKSSYADCSFNAGGNTANFDTQLELSIQRDFPGSSPKLTNEEGQILNHSNASAFSLYGSSTLLKPFFPTKNLHESHKLSENTNIGHQYDVKKLKQENITYLAIGQPEQVDAKSLNSQLELFPATGSTSDNKSMEHDNVFQPMFDAQSGMHPTWTPKSMFHKESSPFPASISSHSNPKSQNSEPRHWSDDATYTCDQNINDQSNIDCDDSPSNGQSCGTSFYHDVENCNTSGVCEEGIGSGSDGNAPSAVVGKNNLESSMNNDQYDGLGGTNSHRTSQREAALMKFRLKRKDRCYDKKVRYESRKRQAENRPRVKGQFVRQVHGELPVADTGSY
ncbi:two-component response regulator-like APRR5 isoform X1 [Trifolium pratense]|uniref:two-component response regulator-like APRR5 isoform X1 n=1 Tax=Trifolium pratense TaxID=57577 RepID=UPI001E69418C|nr:two-component response regulator-like APRR5 isoform X1 [Trifolium pratense]